MFEWTTREGVTMPITEMETSHIKNCMKMIERRGFTRKIVFGSVGLDASDCYYDEEYIDERPMYQAMQIELLKRQQTNND